MVSVHAVQYQLHSVLGSGGADLPTAAGDAEELENVAIVRGDKVLLEVIPGLSCQLCVHRGVITCTWVLHTQHESTM